MSGPGYLAGDWIAMTTSGTWLLADAEAWTGPWAECWAAVRRHGDLESVLAMIASAGALAVADIALVRCDANETRVVVRGRPTVELGFGAPGSTTLVRAADDGEWSDRLFAGIPIALRIARESESVDTRDTAVMPLECGVAQASAVGFGLEYFMRPPAGPAASAAPAEPSTSEPEINLDEFLLRQGTETASRAAADWGVRQPQPEPQPELEPAWETVPAVPAPPEPVSAAVHATASAIAAAPTAVPALPLDDMSWMGDSVQPVYESVAAPTTATATAPLSATVPPQSVPSVPRPSAPQPAAAPPPAPAGLSFDAEATTFRPGRAPVHVGGTDRSVVLAVVCPAGHPSPPRSPSCRACRVPLADQQPRAVARPALGRLRLSTGEVHVLDRGFLLGRSPVPRPGTVGPEPNVLRLISRDGDVSRTHAEIRLEGWQVIVADLGSTNGTYLSAPGLPPRVLSGGEEQVIEPGCVVTLAHDVWIAYEVAE